MGIVRMGPPENLIQALIKKFQINSFIETGTYHGKTSIWASNLFQNVFTIENSLVFYEQVTKTYGEINNIEFIFGDSRTQLKNIVASQKNSSLFWLDAHWSGGETYGEADQCPILEEIEIINNLQMDVYLFIDDARLFLSPPQAPHNVDQWPTISEVINAIQARESNVYIVIIDDCIIAVPLHAKPLVVEYCQKINAEYWKNYGLSLKKGNFKKGVEYISLAFRNKLHSIIF